MTKHQKIEGLPPIDRRSFIVGTAATGLVIGYAAPKIGEALAATAANAEPSIWVAISPDGKVWVTVGKADMGQHIASTMAQLVAEELEVVVERHEHRALLERSEIQRSDSRRSGDWRKLVDRHEL